MNTARLPYMLLLLVGCGHRHFPTCDYETRDVEDDEEGLGDLPFVVRDLLDLAVGTFVIPAESSIGSVRSVELTGSRGEGSAVFKDGTEGERLSSYLTWGDEYLDYGVLCDDRVSVPLDVIVTTDDGSFDLAAEATLTGDSYGDGTTDASAAGLIDEAPAADGETAGSIWAGFDAVGLYRLDVYVGDEMPLSAPPGFP